MRHKTPLNAIEEQTTQQHLGAQDKRKQEQRQR